MTAKTATANIIAHGPFSGIIPSIPSMIFEKIDKEKIEKIYLFGSYAYGEPNEDSDVDICVIIRKRLRRFKMAFKIKTILHDNNIVPSDLLVFRSKDFYEALKIRNIERTIANHGILLYG
jgi:predicted nucleotidyltransferase